MYSKFCFFNYFALRTYIQTYNFSKLVWRNSFFCHTYTFDFCRIFSWPGRKSPYFTNFPLRFSNSRDEQTTHRLIKVCKIYIMTKLSSVCSKHIKMIKIRYQTTLFMWSTLLFPFFFRSKRNFCGPQTTTLNWGFNVHQKYTATLKLFSTWILTLMVAFQDVNKY